MALTWLADVLRSTGHPVVEHDFWKISGRPGRFAPVGVLVHHTAFEATARNPFPAKNTLIRGRPDLRGPLCNVAPDYAGVLHVIAAGRANHAGATRRTGPIPAGDGNELLVGFELDYSGYAAPSPAQLEASVDGVAAVLKRLGLNASHARGHRETSVTGKWDPGQVDLDRFRADVATALAPRPTTPVPTPTSPQEDDDMLIIKIGRTRYRAICGGKIIALEPAFAENAIAAGVKVVGATDAEVKHISDQLVDV